MSQITITSGSDATINLSFRDGEGTALVVANPTLISVDGKLEGRITAQLAAGIGNVLVHIEGTDAIRVGVYKFRVQVTKQDGDSLATPEISVNVV